MYTKTNIWLILLLFILLANSTVLLSVSCSTGNEVLTMNSSVKLSYYNLIPQKPFSPLRRRSRRAFSRNSTASFQLLLRTGDIELNPGPHRSTDHQDQSHQRPNTISPSTASLCRDMPSGLKIVHWNLNSIALCPGNCKLDELRLLLSNLGKECHILGITETWLSSNFKNSEIQITGYCVERLDRDEINLPFSKLGGGGIAAYIDKNIPYVKRKDLETKCLETLWIKLCPPKRPAHLICFAYRCPQYDITTCLKEFKCQITNAYLESCQLTIMGDFNIDVLASNAHVKSCLDLAKKFPTATTC